MVKYLTTYASNFIPKYLTGHTKERFVTKTAQNCQKQEVSHNSFLFLIPWHNEVKFHSKEHFFSMKVPFFIVAASARRTPGEQEIWQHPSLMANEKNNKTKMF